MMPSFQEPPNNTAMKLLRIFLWYLLTIIAVILVIGLAWATFNAADYRLVPRYINGIISLLGVPFQACLLFLGLDDTHGVGSVAKVLGVVSCEVIIAMCLRLLRRADQKIMR
jgi:type IV secretory pathway VirB2 component (pilin)